MPDDDVPDLGPVPTRIEVPDEVVRRLVATQLPQWADLPVRPVATQGWDNRTFHLGPEMSVRLPSAAPYALAVEKEHTWLPVLAPLLPLPVPVPLALGRPGAGYPFAWSVHRWLDGEPASRDNVTDLIGFGVALAHFLLALQRIDPSAGPGPGLHNWYRGGTLATYDEKVRDALATLEGHPLTGVAWDSWQTALRSRWDGHPVWFHGDVAPGNLLVEDGELTAVIDFGTCGVGDPACDLAIAWTLLSGESRTAFRQVLSVDDETWARGRGWALWKTLATCAGALEDGGPELAEAMHILDEICRDHLASASASG